MTSNLPRYGDGAHQPKVDPSHSPDDDVGGLKFAPPKMEYGQDYDDSPEGEVLDTKSAPRRLMHITVCI